MRVVKFRYAHCPRPPLHAPLGVRRSGSFLNAGAQRARYRVCQHGQDCGLLPRALGAWVA